MYKLLRKIWQNAEKASQNKKINGLGLESD